jgi:hypothetical protein
VADARHTIDRMLRRGLIAAVLGSASVGHADVEVRLNAQGEQLAAEFGMTADELAAQMSDQIDLLYRVTGIEELLHAFSNTAAFSTHGLGASYDVDTGERFIGVTVAGIHGDVGIGVVNKYLAGSLIDLALTAGVNLENRWTVFADVGYWETELYGVRGDLFSLGAHVQYQLLPGRGHTNARWTGLAVTTGLDHVRLNVGRADTIKSRFKIGTRSIQMESVGDLTVEARTTSVPIEVSTGARLGRVFGVYVAGGIDLSTGTTTITAALESQLSMFKDNPVPLGEATIAADGSSGPSSLTVHALGGLELHTKHFRLFTQGVVAPGQVGVALGMRAAF